MRLTELQRRIIKEEIARVMGEGARVSLFGSRTDDSRRGGDIDLYLETPEQLALARTQAESLHQSYPKLRGRSIPT